MDKKQLEYETRVSELTDDARFFDKIEGIAEMMRQYEESEYQQVSRALAINKCIQLPDVPKEKEFSSSRLLGRLIGFNVAALNSSRKICEITRDFSKISSRVVVSNAFDYKEERAVWLLMKKLPSIDGMDLSKAEYRIGLWEGTAILQHKEDPSQLYAENDIEMCRCPKDNRMDDESKLNTKEMVKKHDYYPYSSMNVFDSKTNHERKWLFEGLFSTMDLQYRALKSRNIQEVEIPEIVGFSPCRFYGRFLGFSMALVCVRMPNDVAKAQERADCPHNYRIAWNIFHETGGKIEWCGGLDWYKVKTKMTEDEIAAVDKLFSQFASLWKKDISRNDIECGTMEGMAVLLYQLPLSSLYEEKDVSWNGISFRKERNNDDKTRELSSEDVRSALLNWHKSTKEVKALLMGSGKDEVTAQQLINDVCYDIMEEAKKNLMPFAIASATMIVVAVWLFSLNHPTAFLCAAILLFATVFCLNRIYKTYKRYKITK